MPKSKSKFPAAPAPHGEPDVPTGPILPSAYHLTHGPIPSDIVEIQFPDSWRPRHVQASAEEGFAVEGIDGWFRNSDEGKSWRWPAQGGAMKVAVVMVNDGVKCVEVFNPEAEDEQAIRNRHYQEQVADFQKRRPGANPQDHFLTVGFVHVHIHEMKL